MLIGIQESRSSAVSRGIVRGAVGVAVGLFVLLFAFTQPPLVFWIGNRVEPWIGGVPFLYAYLFVLYVALIGVLVWVQTRKPRDEEAGSRTQRSRAD